MRTVHYARLPGYWRELQVLIRYRRETIRRVLNLPPTTTMEYKSNNGRAIFVLILLRSTHVEPSSDSMQDKSSFRVNQSDRTPLS